MKPDLYTKVVLTVIAACLLVLASKQLQLIPTAQASYGDAVQVDIVKINGNRIYDAIPVKVK